MIINKFSLLELSPIENMEDGKLIHLPSNTSYGLSENGYDIRIKQEIKFFDDSLWYANISNRFRLASSIEKFTMPDNLTGIVHDKSTWARRGLSVFNTVIDSGFTGYLTLELVYNGSEPLNIPAGSGIAHIIFHSLAEPVHYAGKYQNQEDEPVGPR